MVSATESECLIYRYDLDHDHGPRMQHYALALVPGGHMVLGAQARIKPCQDHSLSCRRSYRADACGPDGMKINGKNRLACVSNCLEMSHPIVIRPLLGLPVICTPSEYHPAQSIKTTRFTGESSQKKNRSRRSGRSRQCAVLHQPLRELMSCSWWCRVSSSLHQ